MKLIELFSEVFSPLDLCSQVVSDCTQLSDNGEFEVLELTATDEVNEELLSEGKFFIYVLKNSKESEKINTLFQALAFVGLRSIVLSAQDDGVGLLKDPKDYADYIVFEEDGISFNKSLDENKRLSSREKPQAWKAKLVKMKNYLVEAYQDL